MIVREFARRWSLRLGEPFQSGGRSSWVAPATDPAGQDLVLKVGWCHDEAAHEGDGLRAWQGRGAVHLHDAHVGDRTSALLLERCRPGATLAEVVPEPEQDVVLADLLRRLWITAAAGHPFRSLQEMCDAWASEFTDREPWLVVDPKPYVGDPAYDPVQHLLNCDQRLPDDPVGLAGRMADLLDLDRDRVRQWLLARCVQESLDEPWLRDVAVTLAATT